MKTTLRIFRIISKLLLLAYVTIVNFVFITVFYALLLSILRHIWPAYIPGLFDEGDSVFSQYVTVLSFAVIHPLFHFSAKCVGATQKRRIPSYEQFRSYEGGTVAFRNGYEPEAETLS